MGLFDQIMELRGESIVSYDDKGNCFFGFLANWWDNNFGNCLMSCILSVNRKQLLGVNGIVFVGCESYRKGEKEVGEYLESSGALDVAET
ncbi:hypothetical protein PanWU01x14_000950 [Parasponia andersonii]|uniref:Uncharacterized protein n=1 Tax=Parasponia andersonii TaxID=3476 RepID=A0A2P5E4U0_PARAD|nr:hypothetical protein PanWU01x14_000950 [Parasponia andersonii]